MIRQILIDDFGKDNFSYFISKQENAEVAIVDPSNFAHVETVIQEQLLEPKMILLTHSHFDHVAGVKELIDKYGLPVYIHKNGETRLDIAEDFVVTFEDGEKITLGELEIKVIYTPGHIDDSVCYYIDEKNADDAVAKLFTGDTVFVEGCGRADLEGSNVKDLFESLKKIKRLPDNTEIYPGHDYGSKNTSDIAWEKKHNKYFRCKNLEEFIKIRIK